MSGGEHPSGTGYLRWPDLNTHADAERTARAESLRDVRGDVRELAVRVDRIESILDQMRGIRTLMVTVFGGSIVTALISLVTLVALITGGR